jgi:hypothetical protein
LGIPSTLTTMAFLAMETMTIPWNGWIIRRIVLGSALDLILIIHIFPCIKSISTCCDQFV